MVSQTTLTGAAGEYFVMSELLRRGFIAAMAPAGVPNVDIVVTDPKGEQLCAIQVKTRVHKKGDRGWHMGKKHEGITAPHLVYIFVDFGVEDQVPPLIYVVPSEVVADALKVSHATWLSQPGKGGRRRKDSDMRRFLPDYESLGLQIGRSQGWLDPYSSAFHLLGEPS